MCPITSDLTLEDRLMARRVTGNLFIEEGREDRVGRTGMAQGNTGRIETHKGIVAD